MSVSTVDADGIAKVIAGYVHRGLRVVRLNGLVRAGECTCWRRGDCGTPGKHPVGKPWETTTDEDVVFEWWGGPTRYNVGVVLGDAGRGSGPAVIDIEADSDVEFRSRPSSPVSLVARAAGGPGCEAARHRGPHRWRRQADPERDAAFHAPLRPSLSVAAGLWPR